MNAVLYSGFGSAIALSKHSGLLYKRQKYPGLVRYIHFRPFYIVEQRFLATWAEGCRM